MNKEVWFDYESIVKAKVPDCMFIHYAIQDEGVPKDLHKFSCFIEHLYYLYSTNHYMYNFRKLD